MLYVTLVRNCRVLSNVPIVLITALTMALAVACGSDVEAEEEFRPDRQPAPGDAPSSEDVEFVEAFPDLPKFNRPVDMVEVPGREQFLVLLQEGAIVAFDKDEEASTVSEVLDWRNATAYAGGEEGLLGIAFSPGFDDDNHVFLYYSAATGEQRSVVSRFELRLDGDEIHVDPDSELVIIEVPQPYVNHNGGQLAFGPDGLLYIALGDGGSAGDPHGHGQDLSTLLGSILRIDISQATAGQPYAIPEDNPFVDHGEARDEIWAYGLRNPWRFSFDWETGQLWAADVGQQAWEEVNIIEPGGNYGWNIMEGFACYPEPGCDSEGLELPVVDYENTGEDCSITGGFVGRGEAAEPVDGYYVYGDFCSGRIWAIPADATPGSNVEPVELRSGGPPISSFARDLDGNLYVVSFDGPIYRIEASTPGVWQAGQPSLAKATDARTTGGN